MDKANKFNEEKVPEKCPGVEDETAGKSAACAGCPNQSVCASGEAQEEKKALLEKISYKYKNTKKIILIMSGKGGVGKSTISMLIARTIARFTDKEVGFLDIDLCGPSAGRLFGVSGEVHRSNFGLSPLVSEDGINIMSTDFILNSKEDAIIWRGPKKNSLIKELVLNVDWGEDLEYLIIDTPPGTSDEHLSLVDMFKQCHRVSAIVVFTPQEVALIDVRKQLNFLKKAEIPVLGMVENFSVFICPKCHTSTNLFPNSIYNSGTITDIIPLCKIPISKDISYCESKGLNPYEYINDNNHPVIREIITMVKAIGIPLDIQIQ